MKIKEKTYRLDQIADIYDCPHSTPEWTDSGYFVIRNWNVRDGRLNFTKASFTNENTYRLRNRRSKPEYGDIVLTREAPMGEVCLIPKDLDSCLGQRVVLIKPKKDLVSSEYLLMTLQAPFVRGQIMSSEGTGSTVSNLRIPLIESLEIPLPSIADQNKIGRMLMDFDDKIDINNRMNKTLEEIAKTVFKHWFIDFEFPNEKGKPYKSSGGKMVKSELGMIPEGWRIGSISEMLTQTIGGDWGKDDEFEGSIPCICLRGVDLEKLKEDGYSKSAPIRWIKKSSLEKRIIKENDIIIASSGLGPIGRTIYCGGLKLVYNLPVIYSNFCKRFTATSKQIAIFTERLISNIYNEGEMEKYHIGTSIPNLDTDSLMKYRVIIPDKKIITLYSDFILLKFQKLYRKENSFLSDIRNFLMAYLIK